MPTTASLPRRRRTLRTAAALGAAALATGSLAACGSSSDDAGASSGAGSTSALASASPADLLRHAVPATTAKGSYHLALRATISEQGRPLTIAAEGDQASSPTQASFVVRVPSLSATLGRLDVRYRQGTFYARTAKAPGWYAIDVAEFTKGLGPLGGSFTSSQDPKALVTALERKGGVQDAGTEEVGGTATRHLRGTISSRDIAAAGGAAQRRALRELDELGQGDPQVTRSLDAPIQLDFYVQGDGALRRIAFSGTLDDERFQAQADLTDYGKQVDVEAPPASQTHQLTPEGIGKLLMAG